MVRSSETSMHSGSVRVAKVCTIAAPPRFGGLSPRKALLAMTKKQNWGHENRKIEVRLDWHEVKLQCTTYQCVVFFRRTFSVSQHIQHSMQMFYRSVYRKYKAGVLAGVGVGVPLHRRGLPPALHHEEPPPWL